MQTTNQIRDVISEAEKNLPPHKYPENWKWRKRIHSSPLPYHATNIETVSNTVLDVVDISEHDLLNRIGVDLEKYPLLKMALSLNTSLKSIRPLKEQIMKMEIRSSRSSEDSKSLDQDIYFLAIEKTLKAKVIIKIDALNSAFMVPVFIFDVKDDAEIQIFLQATADSDSSLYPFVITRQTARSDVQIFQDLRGDGIVRVENIHDLREEESNLNLGAVYNRISGYNDITTSVTHRKRNCSSHQVLRGIVDGKAQCGFQGKIHVAEGADLTDANQSHKAILLSNEAIIDVKPELEIFADDVKCTHGATVGTFDTNSLFYMLSRGIEPEIAYDLLKQAFLAESLEVVSLDSDLKQIIHESLGLEV